VSYCICSSGTCIENVPIYYMQDIVHNKNRKLKRKKRRCTRTSAKGHVYIIYIGNAMCRASVHLDRPSWAYKCTARPADQPVLFTIVRWPDKDKKRRSPLLYFVHFPDTVPSFPSPKLYRCHLHCSSPHARRTSLASAPTPRPQVGHRGRRARPWLGSPPASRSCYGCGAPLQTCCKCIFQMFQMF
jgi:hypothetical protein